MEGQAEVATKDATGAYLNGTLAYQVFVNTSTAPLFAQFWDATRKNWTVLDDVKIWYNEVGQQSGVNGSNIPSAPGDAAFGSLTTGFGALANPNLFGPELGFGFAMRDALPAGEKILIMKTAWGGKSLGGDFRPPSSVSNFDVYCQEACVNEVGHFYSVMVADVHKMLAPGAIAAMFPDIDASLTPRLAGLGWFHGWNDGCDSECPRPNPNPTLTPRPRTHPNRNPTPPAHPNPNRHSESDRGLRVEHGEPHQGPARRVRRAEAAGQHLCGGLQRLQRRRGHAHARAADPLGRLSA